MGWDARNLCHKFSSQGTALRILGLRVRSLKLQGPSPRVLGLRVPCPSVPRPRVPEPQVPGLRVLESQGPRSQGLGSWVSGPDFRLWHLRKVFLDFIEIINYLSLYF